MRNILLLYCSSSGFGLFCISSRFGFYCNSSTFALYCNSSRFGLYCNSSRFGLYCNSSKFGLLFYINNVTGWYLNGLELYIYEFIFKIKRSITQTRKMFYRILEMLPLEFQTIRLWSLTHSIYWFFLNW